jgi:hypothetical protein
MGAEIIYAGGQTDGPKNVLKVTDAFLDYGKAPKLRILYDALFTTSLGRIVENR